jgi:hypothetical protein
MMFYTEDDLECSAKSVVRYFDSYDKVVEYGFSRIGIVLVFIKKLFFQEHSGYNTLIKD